MEGSGCRALTAGNDEGASPPLIFAPTEGGASLLLPLFELFSLSPFIILTEESYPPKKKLPSRNYVISRKKKRARNTVRTQTQEFSPSRPPGYTSFHLDADPVGPPVHHRTLAVCPERDLMGAPTTLPLPQFPLLRGITVRRGVSGGGAPLPLLLSAP